MKCLLLAGGFATRLYPHTINKAKALIEYKGKPVISHIVDRVPRGLDILVSTNRRFEADFLEWRKTGGRPVEILVEQAVSEEQKLGATCAIDYWIRTKKIREDLLVIAADNYFEMDLTDFVKKFNGRNALVAVRDFEDKNKACDIVRACQLGLVILEGDRVVRLDEKPLEATSSFVSTGIYILPRRVFPMLSGYCMEGKGDSLGTFVAHLLEREEVRAYTFSEAWLDIGDEVLKGNLTL